MKINQGSVAIYIVLLMLLMMTSAAVILSGVLSKHTRAASNYLASERAFAGANSSIEKMLYIFAVKRESSLPSDFSESISYDEEGEVTFKGAGCLQDGVPRLSGSGEYKTLVRRIEIAGGPEGSC